MAILVLFSNCVPITPICRPERPHPHPGWLHHGCHGRVLRAAHRRGEGSIPGPDEPERRGSALQRHHGGLQTDIPAGGLPRPLERFPPHYTSKSRSISIRADGLAHATPCPPRAGTLPNITRNALVNCTELVTYDLIKEAILRHNLLSGERRCSNTNTQTHPPIETADWAESNTPTPNSAPADKPPVVGEDMGIQGV